MADSDQPLWQLAHKLVPEAVQDLEPAGAGANSAVYRVRTANSDYALKLYKAAGNNNGERLDVEWRTLSFLRQNGLHQVPRPIAQSAPDYALVMEWLDGEPVVPHDNTDIDQAIAFMAGVFELSGHPAAVTFPPAAGACLSGTEIIQQIEARLGFFAPHDALEALIAEKFLPAFEAARAAVATTSWSQDLPRNFHKLIPADFGFHNTRRLADGSLRYFDFDYFGWDDPVKLAADFILHPAMGLSAHDQSRVVAGLEFALPEDRHFRERLETLLPLYACRWALIVLNAFRFDRATAAHSRRETHRDLLAAQLRKAQAMIEIATTGADN